MLPFYARHFDTVEINNTSYQFPKPEHLIGWAAATPADFKLSLKVPRRITFGPAALNAAGQLQRFHSVADVLGAKRGPVLMQFAVGFARDDALLRKLLEAVPSDMRSAIELRDASWHADEVFDLLREHNVALCISDSEELTTPVIKTAGFGYFRLRHEGYDDSDLARWTDHIRSFGAETFVYFKHEGTGSGPRFASALLQLLKGDKDG
jgi:uncharacterized protein YecE (DUF72 family)